MWPVSAVQGYLTAMHMSASTLALPACALDMPLHRDHCTNHLLSPHAGYGNYLGRDHVCYDESASVIVMVTDTCPCYYPTNA